MFPGYTLPVIYDMPYDHWLLLAFAYDEHVAEMKRIRPSRARRR